MVVRIRFERRETPEAFNSTTVIVVVETWWLLGVLPVLRRERTL